MIEIPVAWLLILLLPSIRASTAYPISSFLPNLLVNAAVIYAVKPIFQLLHFSSTFETCSGFMTYSFTTEALSFQYFSYASSKSLNEKHFLFSSFCQFLLKVLGMIANGPIRSASAFSLISPAGIVLISSGAAGS